MKATIAPAPPLAGDFASLDGNRNSHVEHFASVVARDARMKGRVLDVGAGRASPTIKEFEDVYALAASLDGLDPSPIVQQNSRLANRWQCTLEDAPVPACAYDALISLNVIEHVSDPVPFLRAAHRVLKPGGVYYAVTPSGCHPFAWTVRAIQFLGLKKSIAEGNQHLNDYPAFYRMNTARAVSRAAREAGFASLEVHAHPCVQWQEYFPRFLRWVPRIFDRLVGVRLRPFWQQVMIKLEK